VYLVATLKVHSFAFNDSGWGDRNALAFFRENWTTGAARSVASTSAWIAIKAGNGQANHNDVVGYSMHSTAPAQHTSCHPIAHSIIRYKDAGDFVLIQTANLELCSALLNGLKDAGDFVLEMGGVRWAVDLGADSYGLPGTTLVVLGVHGLGSMMILFRSNSRIDFSLNVP
jgi:hypothetical protein